MRVLSLHNFAKFGCFISMAKLYRWGVFSQIFEDPSGKTIDGTQKSLHAKMMARTTSSTVQNLVEIARRTSVR